MSKLPIITCLRCGRYNYTDQQICSRCHTPLPVHTDMQASLPYTEETCTIYRAIRGDELLLVSPRMLECASPHWAIRTRWENLNAIHHPMFSRGTGPYLSLSEPGTVVWNGFVSYPYASDIIPLGSFGFTSISPLASDLRRFAPHLQWYPK